MGVVERSRAIVGSSPDKVTGTGSQGVLEPSEKPSWKREGNERTDRRWNFHASDHPVLSHWLCGKSSEVVSLKVVIWGHYHPETTLNWVIYWLFPWITVVVWTCIRRLLEYLTVVQVLGEIIFPFCLLAVPFWMAPLFLEYCNLKGIAFWCRLPTLVSFLNIFRVMLYLL